ncbi:unnamed protein product [Lactuca saligna]|uniref:Uncharacterized protein n=1 Tax=Lactuca saligna TaxID=75948 RepID=A0AA36EKQ2_LACSI|nr:unnamed protein product [Lactuca saligna]
MPSGPKKRRASKRKKGPNGRFIDPATGEEENHVEVHESVNNEREMSFGDKACHAVDEMGLKESQSVDIQTGLKENVKENEDVPVLKKSEYVDRALLHAPLNEPILKNPEENGYGEVVESASQESPVVMKECEETSMRGVLKERLEEPIGRSLDEAQEMVKTVNRSINLPSEEGQDLSVSSKTNVEKSLKDDQDSVVEDVVERNKFTEVGESDDHVNEVVSVIKEREEMSTEVVLKDSFEEPTESSSHELSIPKKEIQDSLDEPVIEVDVETISFEDAPDSFETPLGSPSMADYMSPIEGDDHLINGYMNQQFQRSLPSKSIPLSKVQDPSLQSESLNEVNVQISMEDSQHSFKESAGSFSHVDVSYVQENKECAEVGENACNDDLVLKENGHMSMEDPFVETSLKDGQDSFTEPQGDFPMDNVSSMDHDLQQMVNHVDSVMETNADTSLDEHDSSDNVHINGYGVEQIERFPHKPQVGYKTDESVISAHIETSFKDAQDSLKRSLGDSSIDDVSSMYHGQPQMVNDVESTIKEDEGIPIEGALEENFKEPNVDTSFKVPLGLISSSQVNGSPVEDSGQRNDMVGLVKTLLEEIRRIRAFYEEGLCQTNDIHLRICRVLEKFDSGEII